MENDGLGGVPPHQAKEADAVAVEKLRAIRPLYADIYEMRKSGMSFNVIAIELGVSKNVVAGAVFRIRKRGFDMSFSGEKEVKQKARATALGRARRSKQRVKTMISDAQVATPVAPAPRPVPVRPSTITSPHRACQYISGEPSANDDCKCRKPTVHGTSWCAEHHAKVFMVREVSAEDKRTFALLNRPSWRAR